MDDPERESARLLFEEMDMMDSPTSRIRRQNGSTRCRSSYGSEKNMIGGGLYLPLHIQILKIRDEDSHVGEDICPGSILSVADDRASTLVFMSRPILPSSPLSGRPANNNNHKFVD